MGMIIQNGKIYSGNAERGYHEKTLWTGSETPTVSGTDITLSDSIYNYDEIVFSICSQDNETAQENFRVSDLTIGSLYIQLAYHSNYFGVYWAFTSDTSINIKRISSTGQTAITYLKITGIKYSEVVVGSTYHKYSTNEKPVGEWIDGKTIYEKTIVVQNKTAHPSDWAEVITLSGVDKITHVEGWFTISTVDYFEGYYVRFMFDYSTNKLNYYCQDMANTNGNITVIIRYTKSS